MRDIHQVAGDWVAEHTTATCDEISSAELVGRLVSLPSGRWAELPGRRGGALTEARLARMLKPFDVYPIDIGANHSRRRGYQLTAFDEPFRRVFSA